MNKWAHHEKVSRRSIKVAGFSISAFSEGLLSGVALVLVLYSLWKRRRG